MIGVHLDKGKSPLPMFHVELVALGPRHLGPGKMPGDRLITVTPAIVHHLAFRGREQLRNKNLFPRLTTARDK
jgi:hypothetical protein